MILKKRELAILWWNQVLSQEEKERCMFTSFASSRTIESLTGREIEAMYDSFDGKQELMFFATDILKSL